MLRVIGVAAFYKQRPSAMMGIEDSYTAYCFDEACAFIQQKLKDGEKIVQKKEEIHTHYSTPSQLYQKYDN